MRTVRRGIAFLKSPVHDITQLEYKLLDLDG